MFYEVTIIKPNNKKKKIISSKELSDNYWADFENKQKLFSTKKIMWQILERIKSLMSFKLLNNLNIYSRYL
jgi:hypothetical protein